MQNQRRRRRKSQFGKPAAVTRTAGKPQRLIIGIVTAAEPVAGLRLVVHRQHRADFLAGVEEIVIPVRPRLIDIKVGVVAEREFQRASCADMLLRLRQTAFEFPVFFPR